MPFILLHQGATSSPPPAEELFDVLCDGSPSALLEVWPNHFSLGANQGAAASLFFAAANYLDIRAAARPAIQSLFGEDDTFSIIAACSPELSALILRSALASDFSLQAQSGGRAHIEVLYFSEDGFIGFGDEDKAVTYFDFII